MTFRILLMVGLWWFLQDFPWQLRAAQFTLSWSDNSTNEDGFGVYRSADGTTFLRIDQVGANVTSYVDADLPLGRTYSYKVNAYNVAGNSGFSNTVTGTTPAAPVPVDGDPGVLNIEWEGELVNISTRGLVGVAADQPMIAGFVVQGGPITVLIRAAGPALLPHGVVDAIADPFIQLVGGGSNDNWSGADVVAATTLTGAFAFPAGSKDAALLVRLAPGTYTAHISNNAGVAGTALVEVYKVPTPSP